MAEETFGIRLKRLREAAGLTQQDLADRAGMHRFGVAKLERDERQPSWATVQALAKSLGLTCSSFEGTVEPPSGDKPARPKGRPKKPAGDVPASPPAEEVAKAEPTRKRKGKKGE
jgi:transcriptional regulator with XRE-family HTH domain